VGLIFKYLRCFISRCRFT